MASVGEMLRAAREKKGLTLEAVNQATRISIRVLKALEQDDLEAFESEIYLKGFVRSYAQHLGVELPKIMRALERQAGAKPVAASATWETEAQIKEERIRPHRLFRRFVLPLMLIIIIVLTLLLINERRKANALTSAGAPRYFHCEACGSQSG